MGVSASRRLMNVRPAARPRVDELVHELAMWRDDGESAIPMALEALSDMLALDAASSYRLSPGRDGWDLDFLEWHGPGDASHVRKLWVDAVTSRHAQPTLYDPSRPAARHRNRAVRPRATYRRRYERTAVWLLLQALGMHEQDELRMLVCDGSALLGWFGGWRAESFGPGDAAVLEALGPALATRMKLERDLAASELRLAALVVALEAFPAAALLVRANGSVVESNGAGRALMESDRTGLQQALAEAVAAPEAPGAYKITPVHSNGAPQMFLAIRARRDSELEWRCRDAASRWRLTKRQTEVMRLLVEGNSNKAMAAKIGLSLRTIELHVTLLLEKSRSGSRSELVAKFWA